MVEIIDDSLNTDGLTEYESGLWYDPQTLRLWEGNHKMRLYWHGGDKHISVVLHGKGGLGVTNDDCDWSQRVYLEEEIKYHVVEQDGDVIAAVEIEEVDPEDYVQTPTPPRPRDPRERA